MITRPPGSQVVVGRDEVVCIKLRHVIVGNFSVRALLCRSYHPTALQVRHLPVAVLHNLMEEHDKWQKI